MENILSLTPEQKLRLSQEVGPLQTVSDFCSDLLDAAQEMPLKEKLVQLLPWAATAGRIAGEVTPLAKVLVKVVDEIAREKDPETLGLLACTLAYQHAAAVALAQQGEPAQRVPFQRSLETARKKLREIEGGLSLTGFTLEAAFAHPFVRQADEALLLAVRSAGYSDAEWRQIQLRVHEQFRGDLAEILAHGESAERFAPFTRWLSLGDNAAAYAALNAHVERQRWLFEDRPVLNVEPFTLSQVYVETDCGMLQWKDFTEATDRVAEGTRERFDASSERCGGRHSLLGAVLGYLRDDKFNDAIVIQGAPGSGKSSFSLYLANVLRREGLRPLRVRLKFLDLKKGLLEALAEVVLQPEDGEDPALSRLPRCPDPFLNGAIFDEKTQFGKAEICPYVLILDGWDEINVAVNEGFEIEVQRMLDGIRREFLHPRMAKVRVILTGRHSHAVERSGFLRPATPVLTMRDFTADQLEAYTGKVRTAIDRPGPQGSQPWPVANWESVKQAVASYRKAPGSIEILGLPLLAHLSLRLLAEWKGPVEVLLTNRTTLYRHLTDVTCPKAGKDVSDSDDLHGQARISGPELRKMLHRTAIAITTFGNESIPFEELRLRLGISTEQAMQAANRAGTDHPLTSLMISFYFKGGQRDLGCEFLHKSFREYLYAEGVVEALKGYARHPPASFPRREPYWKDFPESDPRRAFSRELGQILCPRPLTSEVWSHIAKLIEWEIGRPGVEKSGQQAGQPLAPCAARQWEIVRDTLAGLWDWWGEGVHLRPQPFRDRSQNLQYQPALVNELLDHSLPLDRGREALDWWPGRVINADANLGDALCRLNACVHACILRKSGWSSDLRRQAERSQSPERPCQSAAHSAGGTFIFFMPSGANGPYFINYCSRINGAGNRPAGVFPADLDFALADLRRADLREANLSGADLRWANLREADLREADLIGAELRGAYLSWAYLSWADLRGADLRGAYLSGAYLSWADLRGADLSGADLARARLDDARLDDAKLDNVRGLTKKELAGLMKRAKGSE